jgi:hypothetical protein
VLARKPGPAAKLSTTPSLIQSWSTSLLLGLQSGIIFHFTSRAQSDLTSLFPYCSEDTRRNHLFFILRKDFDIFLIIGKLKSALIKGFLGER